jgi:uncharacterized protein
MPDFTDRKTPGVYVTELPAFPPSVVGVDTAVPAFIGYTEKAAIDGKSAVLTPLMISSLADYVAVFGGDVQNNFTIATAAGGPGDFTSGNENYAITADTESKYLLFKSLQLFYANGGAACWVVSVGLYPKAVAQSDLTEGLLAIQDQSGPTMLVIPDASLLVAGDFSQVAVEMLAQCGLKQDRVAVLDAWHAQSLKQTDLPTGLDRQISAFRIAVGDKNLQYGMAYFPYLNTTIADPRDFNFTNFDSSLARVLQAEAEELYPDIASPARKQLVGYIGRMATETGKAEIAALDNSLTNAIPLLKRIYAIAAEKVNVLPPSAAMAGVIAHNDQARGVWNAPANLELTAVKGPTLRIDDLQQGDLSVPIDGKAVNAIRDFAGRGTVVWGARTLDGNSSDWRYIQVRRTLIYVDQSIKLALNGFAFANNDGTTWVSVIAMISGFLKQLWSAGGLVGSTAKEAFSVNCGLGSTMTGQDILDGYMVVQVALQMVHPAEFIELTFQQKMEAAGQ